jgi:hypothetical protein
LLVGINQYPEPIGDLSGCLNDVRLQYELLVHRYGFDPQNIVIVADATLSLPAKAHITIPTRQAIVTAFQTHLGEAEPEDTVIFHYSGHGTYVQDPHPIAYSQGANELGAAPNVLPYEGFDGKIGAIVPTDALDGVAAGEANVILGSTIFLLSRALKTNNVTVVLDSCHAGGGVRGNLVYRATLDDALLGPSQAEQNFQNQLRADLELTDDNLFRQLRQAGIARGVAMTSALATETAAEATVAGFRAGIFTHLLTRYLWQTTAAQPIRDSFVDLARITRIEVDGLGGNQNPIYFTQPDSNLETQPPYLLAATAPAADAVIRDVRSNQTVAFWLGGMTPNGLQEAASTFEVIDNQGNVLGQVQQTSREGLLGQGQPLEGLTVQPGMLMRESIRGIPNDITLRVGLHASLGADAALARQILQSFDRVTVVAVDGQTDTDYLLGRFDQTAFTEVQLQERGDRPDIQAIEPDSIGLFSNALDPLPSTFSSQYESVGEALERLSSRLRLLLANRALRTILNTDATTLQVQVEVTSNQRGGVGVVSSRGQNSAEPQVQSQIARMQVGEEMSLRVTNREDRSLFMAVIAVERDGDMYLYHPSHWNVAELEAELSPGESVVIPKDDDVFYLPIQGPAGHFEVLVIASTAQLRDTLQSLRRLSDRTLGDRGQLIAFTPEEEQSRDSRGSSLGIVSDILGDLDRNASAAPALREEQYSVNTAQLAALSVVIEVVDG